jgi:hypothetical protein
VLAERARDGEDRQALLDDILKIVRLAASLADQAPVSLVDAVTGIDDRNVGLQGDPPRFRATPIPLRRGKNAIRPVMTPQPLCDDMPA